MNDASVPAEPGVVRRVLVVEDQADSRETLSLLLRLWGHQVEAVGDGLEAVHRALSWRPDAAVVDIGLPLLDGWEVARRVRSALRGDILLIALTGYNGPEDRRRSEEAGFDVHMSKPAQPEALQDLLAR
jgi:CheY-like chemotaxis protein